MNIFDHNKFVNISNKCYGISCQDIIDIKHMGNSVENISVLIRSSCGNFIIRKHISSKPSDIIIEVILLSYLNGRVGRFRVPILKNTITNSTHARCDGFTYTSYDYLVGSNPVQSLSPLILDLCQFVTHLHGIDILPLLENVEFPAITNIKPNLISEAISLGQKLLTISESSRLENCLRHTISYINLINAYPNVIVHNDLHRGNILTGLRNEMTAVIDFGDANISRSVLDYAGIFSFHCIDENGHISEELTNLVLKSLNSSFRPTICMSSLREVSKIFLCNKAISLYKNSLHGFYQKNQVHINSTVVHLLRKIEFI